jgi:hypothetical protein
MYSPSPHFELAARPQSELDLVLHSAGDPTVGRNARHGREAHSGRAANHLQHGLYGRDLLNLCDIGRQRTVVRWTHQRSEESLGRWARASSRLRLQSVPFEASTVDSAVLT